MSRAQDIPLNGRNEYMISIRYCWFVFSILFVLIATHTSAQESCYDPETDTSSHTRFEAAPSGEPFVLVLGDSNSLLRDAYLSWPARLKQILGVHVMNAAIGGSIAGGAHPQDKEDITEDLAFSGPKQFEKAKLSIEQDSDAIVLISMGGNDLMHFGDTAQGVIDDLEALRSSIIADPIFHSVSVYFVKVAPFDPDSTQGQEHGAKIQQINEHLETTYSGSGHFIVHDPDIANYTDAVHFDSDEHLRRAELVKLHLVPNSDLRSTDTDADSISDGLEFFFGTSGTDTDSDDDGLGDTEELSLETSPSNADSDGDGSVDGIELSRETGVSGGVSACQQVTYLGTAESFLGDKCVDTSSDPTKAFGDDASVPTGVVDSNGDGCFEKGSACENTTLVSKKTNMQQDFQSLYTSVRKIFKKRRKSKRRCSWNSKKLSKELTSISQLNSQVESLIARIPDSFDSCPNTEVLSCTTSQHHNIKTELQGLVEQLLSSVRKSARCVFGKRFTKKRVYKNSVSNSLGFNEKIDQFPDSTTQCE